jgi:Flp pilus assembly protein TadD
MDAKRSQTVFLTIVAGLRDQGKAQAALAYLDEFDRQFPGVPYAALLRAQCLMDVGRPEEAKPVFAKLARGDYAAAAQAGLGSVAAARDDWAHAVGNFREASRLEPAAPQYANDLGFAQVKLGDYGGGVDMLGRASQLAPDNRFIRNNLILGLHLSGRDQEAARVIEAIAEPKERAQAQQLLLVSAGALGVTAHPETQTAPAKTNDMSKAEPAAVRPTDAKPAGPVKQAASTTKTNDKEIKS